MAKPFAQYDYDDAIKWFGVRSIAGTTTFLEENPRRPLTAISASLFYDGDHWQAGKGFIGQMPPRLLPERKSVEDAIKQGFVSENVIREVTKTHVGGILGREPAWTFVEQDADEATRSDEASFGNLTAETLTPWWNKREALTDLQETATTLILEGRAVRRVFIPRGLLQQGRVTAKSLEAALDLIYIGNYTADVAGVFTDPDTQKRIGIYLYDELDDKGDVKNKAAELSFLDDAGRTVIKIVRDDGPSQVFPALDLGGHLLVYELEREALITPQVQSSQKALNLARTMKVRNVNLAGSRERVITNATHPVQQRRVTTGDTTTVVTEPGKFETGAGAVMNLVGLPIYDKADSTKIIGHENPNVNVIDPAPVNTFIETIDDEKQAIYSQCHQRHVLIVDKADTSGRAREVARREFERSLKESKVRVDASGRWELEVVLRLAATISNDRDPNLRTLRADFNCLIDAGEPDPEKQKVAILLLQANVISPETARNWCGVEDAAAELARIKATDPSDPALMPTNEEQNAPALPANGPLVESEAVT